MTRTPPPTAARRHEPFRPPFARAAACALLAAIAPGCQSYTPRPLDPASARDQWLARSPSDETARQFAGRLARAEGRPGDFDPADGLTLAEAEPVALVFNRELRLARLRADATRIAADHAGLWDDPVAGIQIERILSGVADPWVAGGTIGLTIPISGRLAVEKARAGAEHTAAIARLAADEWATRTALRELWVEWSAQVYRVRLATDLVERLRVAADLAARQERAGAMSRIDARLLRVELATGEASLIAAAARARELELRVRDTLGVSTQAPVRLVESLSFEPRGLDGADPLEAMTLGNPDLAAVRSEYEVAEQSLRLQVRRQYPDLTIGPGYGTDQGDDRVLLGVQLPIPLWNRNRAAIAGAAAEREVARARFESEFEHLASKLAIALARHKAGRAMREAIESRVLPLADEQEADVRRVAELGRVDPLLLLQAVKSRDEAKARLVDALAAEAVGAIRLDELLGPPGPRPTDAAPQGGTR